MHNLQLFAFQLAIPSSISCWQPLSDEPHGRLSDNIHAPHGQPATLITPDIRLRVRVARQARQRPRVSCSVSAITVRVPTCSLASILLLHALLLASLPCWAAVDLSQFLQGDVMMDDRPRWYGPPPPSAWPYGLHGKPG